MDDVAARELARALLARAAPRRWRHVQAVAAEARRLADRAGIEPAAVTCAAWLHDIGYAQSLHDSGFHPLDGARYLRAHGWDGEICRLVAHHTDAAQRVERQDLADLLNAEFPCIDGIERDILWTADVTTGPTGERVTLDERIDEIVNRYGVDSGHSRSLMSSRPALAAAVARTATRTRDRQPEASRAVARVDAARRTVVDRWG